MSGKQALHGACGSQLRRWRRINIWIDRILMSVLLFLMIFIGSGLISSLTVVEEGRGSIKYQGFSQLMKVNPDTVAWLTMDGTRIDHPVVRSEDNFDYLDLSFDGRYYAGGTLFMDKENGGIEDKYCIIHGHNMAGGAMFGDLDRYLDPGFFERNRHGTLLTPMYDYDILVLASGIFDAYDWNVYAAGAEAPCGYIRENAVQQRDADGADHFLALSTCFDDMTDRRVVVLCALTGRRTHI